MFKLWARLEPERCRAHRDGGFVAGRTLFRAFSGTTSDALLHLEVKRATKEWGWSWEVDLNYPVGATVTCPRTAQRFEGVSTKFPGEALLDAYLEALKSQ